MQEHFRRLGYLAVNSGFAEAELLAMTRERIDFWVGCISMHFAWVKEAGE